MDSGKSKTNIRNHNKKISDKMMKCANETHIRSVFYFSNSFHECKWWSAKHDCKRYSNVKLIRGSWFIIHTSPRTTYIVLWDYCVRRKRTSRRSPIKFMHLKFHRAHIRVRTRRDRGSFRQLHVERDANFIRCFCYAYKGYVNICWNGMIFYIVHSKMWKSCYYL